MIVRNSCTKYSNKLGRKFYSENNEKKNIKKKQSGKSTICDD